MKTVKLGYMSHDEGTQVRALMWQPDVSTAKPRAIIQLVHGMAEHIERYIPFAEYLVAKGFVVCAADHVGHGKSLVSDEFLGHIPLKGGKDILVEDIHSLRQVVAPRFSSTVPYVIFGHSMGSFIVRAYITRHGEGLAGAVICGTGQQPRVVSVAGNVLCHILAAIKGETYRSPFVDGLGAGGFGKQIDGARTDLDWLSTDPAVVDAYIADPACGQMFTVGGYAALTDLAREVVSPSNARKVAKDLPLLFVSGSADPVGGNGKGVDAAVREYRKAGVTDVSCILYDGMRHEILNEPDHQRVFDDVAAWIDEKIADGFSA